MKPSYILQKWNDHNLPLKVLSTCLESLYKPYFNLDKYTYINWKQSGKVERPFPGFVNDKFLHICLVIS